jgi:hypothetical protein
VIKTTWYWNRDRQKINWIELKTEE